MSRKESDNKDIKISTPLQFQKLINIYMEIYENTTDKEYCVKIAQIIADIVHLRPHFDFEVLLTRRGTCIIMLALLNNNPILGALL